MQAASDAISLFHFNAAIVIHPFIYDALSRGHRPDQLERHISVIMVCGTDGRKIAETGFHRIFFVTGNQFSSTGCNMASSSSHGHGADAAATSVVLHP